MSDSLSDDLQSSESSTEVKVELQVPALGHSICARMEPVKRMLTGQSCLLSCASHSSPEMHSVPPCLMCDQQHSVVGLENVCRVALMVTPQASGDAVDEAWEAISTIRAILKQQSVPMTVTIQTVFLRRAEDEAACRKLFHAYYGDRLPATNFVIQPPCGGQSLAIEAWALGGENTKIEFPFPEVVSVAYDGLRWIHIGGITPPASITASYAQAKYAFDEMSRKLRAADASFRDVVRTWLYIGGITEVEGSVERYRELNRARTDFFNDEQSHGRMALGRDGNIVYPASTGIGMAGRGLDVSCLALQTQRADVRLLALENPHQTAAYDYSPSFSTKSPKFSRAMAMAIGDYVTTWISGTASIVNSESVHLDDVAMQTEQTISNIQNLISTKNFLRHGLPDAGAQLSDLAKVRIYVKRPRDYETCKAICERRFGPLPTIYAQADVCRSELLVEIEGVAFSRRGRC